MTSKKPYFPNNWKKFKDAPDDVFKPLSWEEFHEWRVSYWELPESVCCIIRCENKNTGKVTEYSYSRGSAATKRLHKLLEDPNNEITIADTDEIFLLTHFADDALGIDPEHD